MDNDALFQVISKVPELKFNFMGVYPAEKSPIVKKNSFQIINTSKSSEIGEHWIMLANRNNVIFYGDSLGQPLESYGNIKVPYNNVHRMIHKRLQNQPLCGVYAIFFAWSVFSGNPVGSLFNDFYLLRFIRKYL